MSALGFTALSDTERNWIQAQLESAEKFVSLHSPSDSWNPIRLEALDRAWSAWMTTGSDKGHANDAINAVGIAFGSLLAESGVFSWVISTDAWGTDLAIRALPGQGDVTVFPADFVSKRWERGEDNFISHSYDMIMQHVEETQSEWRKAK